MDFEKDQRNICDRYGASHLEAPGVSKLGISKTFNRNERPIHGLRHKPENGTCGWYIWTGDLSEAADFFDPLHTVHLADRCPELIPYLGLAPGWRFLLADQYVDVWFDETLLHL
jgi:hypothetical protein